MSRHELTREQRDRFARNGFLVLRDAVDAAVLDDALAAVAETVPEDLDDFDAMVAGPERRNYWGDLDDMEPFDRLNERLLGYAEELVGEGALRPPGEFAPVAVRYPEGAAASDETHPTVSANGNPHVDGFHEDGSYRPFTVGATTYLDDVNPRGGGLTVWPGSHCRVATFFEGHDFEAYSNEYASDLVRDRCDPFEVVGDAGTVVLWHNLLVHTGGMNLGRRPRVASFTRFLHDEVDETERATKREPFDHWAGVDPEAASLR